ncbi:3-(3-hydroxy-phenyl)propionate hydroxylase [Lentzea xinjiangensis]|uniref:3-(3-hydroxy-phenyl)propionate hydroxylase n=1 Tax=Lentzea xinjiangensis TaxID=402600 RepID=A0A1H9JNB6_9PSEU|nr:FAD-dependent monooxygenase [Lentzea xinjiangensis]SEQ88115.1 3-(3-hydroxy-phenyl)propionate hydroxylase [Lentzea xinjiangensis]
MNTTNLPVAVIGAGPIGLITALGLVSHGVPVVVFEAGAALSSETRAGTVLTRTLEVLDRYGALGPVLEASLRLDEIGQLDRATGASAGSVLTSALAGETRFPFVVNVPQHELEPVLAAVLRDRAPDALRMRHRLVDFTQHPDGVTLRLSTPEGMTEFAAAHVLGCDGGRSTVRERLGVPVSGHTLGQRYALVDLVCDLDVEHPRDYPYLAYFGDREEWVVLVRQPHCWRFVFPLPPGRAAPTPGELRDKARRFIGDAVEPEVLGSNVYTVHHRVASSWRRGRVFLLGDAAHLITPMWALGLNTGVLDASNLPWRLAWVRRGWASEELLEGYEDEQKPVAVHGSAAMAEAARAVMDRRLEPVAGWSDAMTRTLLGVRLGSGPPRTRTGAPQVGDRVPDLRVFGPRGPVHLHELCRDSFVALHLTDARRRPHLPADGPAGLRQVVVSRWDAPHDSGLRSRAYFDPGSTVRDRLGDVAVLLRPDAHIAHVEPWTADSWRHVRDRYLREVRLAG